jgi:hypothetical protein
MSDEAVSGQRSGEAEPFSDSAAESRLLKAEN